MCNAVGILNHKFFFLFVLYTFIACVSCLTLIFVRLIRCGNPPSDDDDNSKTNATKFFVRYISFFVSKTPNFESDTCNNVFSSMVLLLSIVAMLFMMFTLCMLFEQIEAIKSNISKIARMKLKRENGDLNSNPELARVSTEFNEIFGGTSPSFAWHWLLPIPVKFPPGMYDQVMGYEWDSSFPNEPYRPPSAKITVPVANNIESTSSTEEEVCTKLLEKPETISSPLESINVDDSPLLQPDSGMKRRNTNKEEEQIALLDGQETS